VFEFTFQLKQVALRLKRNVTEKTEEIERLKSENAKISSKSQNLSTIQQEFDKALDEVERLKRLESSLQKDLRSAVDENLILKEKSFENQALIQVQNSESFLILQDIY
jgi:chaperonin cofactor prefoldin